MSSTDEPDEAAIAELDADTAGAVLVDGDDGYDDARHVWNGRFDQHPAVIVGCQTTIDVRAAIDFAKGRSLPLAVKGGGHDYGGLN